MEYYSDHKHHKWNHHIHHKHHNRNHHNGWFRSNEYQVDEPTAQPAHLLRSHEGHVALRTNVYKEPITDAELRARATETESAKERYEGLRFGDHSAIDSVDKEAEAFIQFEHKRMELDKLMSMKAK